MSVFSRRRFNQGLIAGAASLMASNRLYAQRADVFTIAGTGEAASQIEPDSDAIAIRTAINNPYGVVIGPDRALYFCEVDSGLIRRVSLATNKLSTIAGNGEKRFEAESRNPLNAPFHSPHEIRWDDENSLYVVERDSHCIKRIDGRSGLVTTLAGSGAPGFEGDGRSAVLAKLNRPHSIAFDSKGNLLICDLGNSRLRQVSRESGLIETIAGTGENSATPSIGPMMSTPLLGPRTIDTDPDGNAYLVLREGNAVFQLDLDGNSLKRIAGTGEQGYSGDGGDALTARFNGPKGIAYSRQDNSLYIADTENHAIRKVQLGSGTITTVLGTGTSGDGPEGNPEQCRLNRPHGLCVYDKVLYVGDSENHRIRAVTGIV